MKWVRRFGLMLMLLGMRAAVGATCACAAEGGVATVTVNGNSTPYKSLSAAVAQWVNATDATLTLLKSCSSNTITTAGSGLTLDLNGFTLTGKDKYGDVIYNTGSLEIKNGTLVGEYGVNNPAKSVLTLNNVTINATNTGVHNYGRTSLTGNISIEAKVATFSYGGGEIDLSKLTGKTVENWTVYAYEYIPSLENIELPQGYALWYKDEVANSLTRGQKATINPTAPIAANKITIQASIGGKVVADKDSAQEGEKVKLTCTPDAGYVLSAVTVTAANGDNVAVTENEFTMPGAEVTISAQFVRCSHSGVEPSYAVSTENRALHSKTYACCGAVSTEAHSGGVANCVQPAACQLCGETYGEVNAQNHVDDQFTYTADAAAQSISKRCGCGQERGKITLKAPEELRYDGQPKGAVVTVDDGFGAYILTYSTADGSEPVNAGRYTVTLEAGQASINIEYVIAPVEVTVTGVTINDAVYQPSGNYVFDITDVTFSGLDEGKTLTKGTDYTVAAALAGENHAGAATAHVTVTMVNANYQLGTTGSTQASASVNIRRANIAEACVTLSPEAELTYTGEAITPGVTVAWNGTELTKDVDYSVAYAGNLNVTDAGAKVVVTGMGGFEGENSCAFSIAPADIGTAEVQIEEQVYTGAALMPKAHVTWHGRMLNEGIDYEIGSYANNTAAGTASVKIVGKGNFTGEKTGSFQIKPADVRMSAVLGEGECIYGEAITVSGTITPVGDATWQPSGTVRLLCAATELASTTVSDGNFSVSYPSASKLLPVGPHTLRVVYTGAESVLGVSMDVEITLRAREVTMRRAETVDRAYLPDDCMVEVKEVELSGVLAEDEVIVSASTAVVSKADAGHYTTVVLPEETALSGKDAAFYLLTGREAAANVTIHPRKIAAVEAPEKVDLTLYCTTEAEAIAQLPDVLTCRDGSGMAFQLPISWACANPNSTPFDASPGAVNRFAWVVSAGGNFALADEVKTGDVTVKNAEALPVNHGSTDKTITYDGAAYDVSLLFTPDPHAGAPEYAIAGGDGAGTLEGTMLTITRAGQISIRMNTAANGQYAAGEALAVLTVNKGEIACTAPGELTAVCGQTLGEIALPEAANGVWRWKDESIIISAEGAQVFKAVFTPDASALWHAREMDVTVIVSAADVPMMDWADTYLGDAPAKTFTYGETITVKATLAKTGAQVALFSGDQQLSLPVSADAQGVYTITYNTTDKLLPAGASTLTVRSLDDEDSHAWSAELPVMIEPAVLHITGAAVAGRPYQPGERKVNISSASLGGMQTDEDEVYVDAAGLQGMIASDAAGRYEEVQLPAHIALKGADAQFYRVQGGGMISASVEIAKAEPASTGTVEPSVDKEYTPGLTLGDLKPTLPAGTFDVPGTLSWTADADTPVTPGASYEWVFTPDDTANYKPVSGAMVIYAVVQPKPPVVIKPDEPVISPEPPVVTPRPVAPPSVIHPAEDQLVMLSEGETVVLTVQAANAAHFQWYVDRGDGAGFCPMSGETGAQLVIVGNAQHQANQYFCRIVNADGAVNSPLFILEVLPVVTPPLTGDDARLTMWFMLLLTSAAGLLALRKTRCLLN